MRLNEQPPSQLDRVAFATTHWTTVLAAKDRRSPHFGPALEWLCRTYWYPLYAYVRRQGYDEESAKDLIQEFFCRLIDKNYLQVVAREKGKFRCFLLACLKHFLGAERVRGSALKRGGGCTFVPLDDEDAETLYALEHDAALPPDELFDRNWAWTVMQQALGRLEEELRRGAKEAQFHQLKRFLAEDPEDGSYAAAALALRITPNAVRVTVHRMRKRYGELVRAEVAQTLAHPTEVEAEMGHLWAALIGS